MQQEFYIILSLSYLRS